MPDDFKEVDRFWPDDVPVRKEWQTYHRAIVEDGKIVIQQVHPAIGENVPEGIYPPAPLTYAEADALVAQIMAAMKEVKKKEKHETKEREEGDKCP